MEQKSVETTLPSLFRKTQNTHPFLLPKSPLNSNPLFLTLHPSPFPSKKEPPGTPLPSIQIPPSNQQLISNMEKQGSKRSLFTSPFLDKTYTLLSNPDLEHIISWNYQGNMVVINDIQELSNILPRYFKHRKIQSFIRQLNIYDFKKVKKQVAYNAFRHPYFLRDDLSRVHLIKRRVKGRGESRGEEDGCGRGGLRRKEAGVAEVGSDKTSEFCESEGRCEEPMEMGIGGGEDSVDGLDYLCHDLAMPVNHSYYDWEDVFA